MSKARAISNKYDLMGLIDCPENEYDQETTEILSALRGCESPKALETVIINTYNKMFGESFKTNEYISSFAEEFFELRKSFQEVSI